MAHRHGPGAGHCGLPAGAACPVRLLRPGAHARAGLAVAGVWLGLGRRAARPVGVSLRSGAGRPFVGADGQGRGVHARSRRHAAGAGRQREHGARFRAADSRRRRRIGNRGRCRARAGRARLRRRCAPGRWPRVPRPRRDLQRHADPALPAPARSRAGAGRDRRPGAPMALRQEQPANPFGAVAAAAMARCGAGSRRLPAPDERRRRRLARGQRGRARPAAGRAYDLCGPAHRAGPEPRARGPPHPVDTATRMPARTRWRRGGPHRGARRRALDEPVARSLCRARHRAPRAPGAEFAGQPARPRRAVAGRPGGPEHEPGRRRPLRRRLQPGPVPSPTPLPPTRHTWHTCGTLAHPPTPARAWAAAPACTWPRRWAPPEPLRRACAPSFLDEFRARSRPTTSAGEHTMTTSLAQFAQDIASGALRVIDLTHSLSSDFPALQLPPQFGQVWAFKSERISHYDEAGPGWYWNNFSCGEHPGPHFDAPAHWITGKDHPDNPVDTMDTRNFIGPAVVVDASAEVAGNDDWLLTVDFLKAWEDRHGRIPAGAWLLFRTGWANRLSDPSAFANLRADGAHTPGPTQETVQWLIGERDVRGFGVETINTDAGQSYAWSLAYPCHTLMHGANKFGLQCLRNLDQLPPTGAVIVAAPLKIQAGSGSK